MVLFKRALKNSGVLLLILMVLPVVAVKSGLSRVSKLFAKSQPNSQGLRAVDNFVNSLSNKAHADIYAGVDGCTPDPLDPGPGPGGEGCMY